MKHLVKNDQIVMSGIPGTFTRENGEGFWGGYENRTDLHDLDGWYDEIIPEYDPKFERLGDPFYSVQQGAVLYEILPVAMNLEDHKSGLYVELAHLREEMANIIVQIKLNYEVEPEGLIRLMPVIRSMYGSAKQEIESLNEESAVSYILRSPKYEQLLSLLKTFL